MFTLEATGPKVNDFYAHFTFLLKHNVLRLKVAMNDLFVFHEVERVKQLNGKKPDLVLVEPVVVIGSNQLE